LGIGSENVLLMNKALLSSYVGWLTIPISVTVGSDLQRKL